MSVQAISLTLFFVLASSTAEQTCSEAQCDLVPVEGDVAFKFQKLTAEKGVRMVYLNLEMGNENFHPLESNEKLFAKRWVWAKTMSEPMLSFPDDYDIYSLGLLNYQVRYINVHLEEQPPGCLARLNPSCQENVVGKTLLGNLTKANSGNRLDQEDCVCAMYSANSTERMEYQCCSIENVTKTNHLLVRCGTRIQSPWLQTLNVISAIFQFVIVFYSPAIALLLPDLLFNLQQECVRENIRNNQVSPDQQTEMEQRETSEERTITEHPNNNEGNISLQQERDEENEEAQHIRNNPVSPDQQNEIEQRGTSEEGTITEHPCSRGMSPGRHEIEQRNDSEKDTDSSSVAREEQERFAREIPLDDVSPITFYGLLNDYICKGTSRFRN